MQGSHSETLADLVGLTGQRGSRRELIDLVGNLSHQHRWLLLANALHTATSNALQPQATLKGALLGPTVYSLSGFRRFMSNREAADFLLNCYSTRYVS